MPRISEPLNVKVWPRSFRLRTRQVALYQKFLGILNPALMTIVNADT